MLLTKIKQTQLSPKQIRGKIARIYTESLSDSKLINKANFDRLENHDLESLFDKYDEHFFDGAFREKLNSSKSPLAFRLSGKMVRAGGKTTRQQRVNRRGKILSRNFEIAISSTLLFSTFQENDRPIHVAGLICQSRLEALMRVMEHEIVHLGEMLLWNDSSCSAYRFREISQRLFRHRESNHKLITPQERAAKDLGIRPGDQVRFCFDGTRKRGKVNRITRRATVLVLSQTGDLYSDGNRYEKFYVPLDELKRCRQ